MTDQDQYVTGTYGSAVQDRPDNETTDPAAVDETETETDDQTDDQIEAENENETGDETGDEECGYADDPVMATPIVTDPAETPAAADDEVPAEEAADPAQGNPVTATGASGLDDMGGLFDDAQVSDIRGRWQDIQVAFVDDPATAVARARELNDEVVRALASALDARKQALAEWTDSGDTEQLRLGLRQYRQVLERIVAL